MDIFDAGPTVEASIKNIHTAQHSRKLPVVIGDVEQSTEFMMINTKIQDFRGVAAPLQLDEQQQKVVITAETARALNVEAGEEIRLLR